MSRGRACAMAGLGLILALGATVGSPHLPGGEPGASLAIRLPDVVWMTVIGLFGLSFLLLLSLQRPRRPAEDDLEGVKVRRPPRPSAVLASLPVLLLMILFVYWAWSSWVPGAAHPLEAPLAALAGLLDLLAQARKPTASVPAFDYAIGGLALLLGLATFALMLLVVFAERILRWWDKPGPGEAVPPFDAAVAESLDDLRAEPDARAAIIRAYRRFEVALSGARVPRAAWQTPSEFMRAVLGRAAIPAAPVARLTALFELARFSDRPLGADARAAACDCLDEVKTALESEAADAR